MLKFIPRGNALFVNTSEGKPVAFKDHPDVKAILEKYGTTIAVAQTQNQQGNFVITLDTGSWGQDTDVSSYDRIATLKDIHDWLTTNGIPARTEDKQQVLNLQTAGPQLQGQRGRLAVLRLYVNLSVLNKTHTVDSGTGTNTDPMDERLSNATAAYVVAFSVEEFSAVEARFSKLGKGPFAGILEGLVNKAKQGGAPAPVVEEPTAVQAPEGETLPV